MLKLAVMTPCLLVLAAPLAAQTGPAFDCAKATSQAEEMICDDAALAALDRRLAERYEAALDAAGKLESGASEAVETLRATQRGWIGGRDECWKATDPRDCIANAYLRREGALVAAWMLEEPSSTAFWTCDGNPANELVTMYFDTELPSIRFERGDMIDTGSLAPAASGAKYDGSFGRFIWSKGAEASYREADPDGTVLDCRLRDSR